MKVIIASISALNDKNIVLECSDLTNSIDDALNRTDTAVPQVHCFFASELALQAQAQVQRLGNLRNGSSATSLEGVFAAGDLVNGGITAVQGISEGMRAAEEIDRYL